MADLTPLTRDALDRAMRAAHWHRLASDVYERRMTRHFAVGAQYWIEGAGVEVETLISMRCPRADMALVDLGADDADSAVTRSPLDHAVTIECADQIEAAVAGLVRAIDAAAERMRRYADVYAFVEAIASDDETRDGAPIVVPVVLGVTGRKREARERARLVPGDFAERLDRWLAGERPPPPPGFEEEKFFSADVLNEAVRKARAVTPEERPQASWGDVWRTGRTVARALRGELPPDTVLPDRERGWEPVELDPAAGPWLEQARERSPLAALHEAFVAARLEPAGGGRLRVLIDATEVGTVAAPGGIGAATVAARIARTRRNAPLSLAIQLPDPPAP